MVSDLKNLIQSFEIEAFKKKKKKNTLTTEHGGLVEDKTQNKNLL